MLDNLVIFCSLRPRQLWFLGRNWRNIIIRSSVGWGSQEVRQNECRDYRRREIFCDSSSNISTWSFPKKGRSILLQAAPRKLDIRPKQESKNSWLRGSSRKSLVWPHPMCHTFDNGHNSVTPAWWDSLLFFFSAENSTELSFKKHQFDFLYFMLENYNLYDKWI